MRGSLLMAFCLTLLEGAALAQAPDVGIKYYVVDRSQYFTSNFTYNVEAGQQVVLNICYANAGSGDASGMSYAMTLPTGLSGVAVTSTQAGSTSGIYNSGTGALMITGLPDPLAAGSQLCPSADVYLYYFSRVVVSFTAPSSTFDAVATVATSTAQSPNVIPDSITGHFVVSGGPTLTDVRILIEGPVVVGPGVPVEYTVGAQNLGPRDAQNVAVSVRLPLGTTGVAVAGGTFDAAAGLVSWPIAGTLAAGGQQMFSFSIANPPLAQGVASVFSDNHETDYFNNVLPFNLSPTAAVFLGAVSRRTHGTAGTFDLPLSTADIHNPTTEPRQGPVQTLVFTFDKPITGATIAVSEGIGTPDVPTLSGNDIILDLTGVPDQQYVTISLTNVSSSDGTNGGTGSARIGFLAGDVNQSRVVSVADLGLVNAQLSQPVTAANFLKDVNVTGTLTVADKGITNANLTKALPAP